MRRRVAYVFYILGLMLGLGALTANGGGFMGTLYGIVGAVAVWWIACGFGVRLGVTPDEFASSVKHLLGFGVDYELPKEPRRNRPQKLDRLRRAVRHDPCDPLRDSGGAIVRATVVARITTHPHETSTASAHPAASVEAVTKI